MSPSLEHEYLQQIQDAPVYQVAQCTPLAPAPSISARLDQQVYLKREDLQPIFSFKLRGAYNCMRLLDAAQGTAGVIAASAGNHAQGVALAAQKLGLAARIVMPVTTPSIKVDAVRRLGAKIVLHGDQYDLADAHARELAVNDGASFIHPFDDPAVIAGQGTIGMEILQQAEQLPDAIFAPVGGGGLIGGIAAYVKAVAPQVRVVGVECEDSACLAASMAAGKRVVLDEVGLFADGVAVKQVGKLNFDIAKVLVDEVITVSVDQICAAVKDVFEDTRTLAEPAGALALAGLKKYAEDAPNGQRLVAIHSGANVNFDRLGHVVERAELGEGREALLAVTIPEQAGSFLQFCHLLGHHGVREFNYRYCREDQAEIFVGLMASDAADKQSVIDRLAGGGYEVLDLSDNELAKLHIRHMVGGVSQGLENELIYRFEFPERPGALLEFLTKLAGRWNISLFHYRNHGAAIGRVLAGFTVPRAERDAFQQFLATLGYRWTDATSDPAYQRFLTTAQASQPKFKAINR